MDKSFASTGWLAHAGAGIRQSLRYQPAVMERRVKSKILCYTN
ncbi:hypothetical protein [Mucilaginibacter sp. SG564]|nr:hypothetical protein [Mucilaginibacter sp. SG564]